MKRTMLRRRRGEHNDIVHEQRTDFLVCLKRELEAGLCSVPGGK
jgi:hypothetical protein